MILFTIIRSMFCSSNKPRDGTLKKSTNHEHLVYHVEEGLIKPISHPCDRGIQTELTWAGAKESILTSSMGCIRGYHIPVAVVSDL